MATITIELPTNLVPPASTPEEFGRDLRLAAAIHWYSRGLISQGKGAEIAGMNRREFLEALFEAKVEAFQVDLDELTREAELDLQARRERLVPDLSHQGGHP